MRWQGYWRRASAEAIGSPWLVAGVWWRELRAPESPNLKKRRRSRQPPKRNQKASPAAPALGTAAPLLATQHFNAIATR